MTVWSPYAPSKDAPWNWQRVMHLHRRAGFGASWKTMEEDVELGPHRAVDRVLSGDSGTARDDFEEMSQILGDAAVTSGEPNRLKAWWMYRLMFSPHALREKLTLLWHNHFATSNLKVRDLTLMRRQNEIFRTLGMAKFGDLLNAVVKDPAMLIWLDADSNRKGQPNENLARELMELFTLGIGNYTEDDVKHAARALTGWTVKRNESRFRADRHDDGDKTVLGRTQRLDADGLLQLLLVHPATPQRIVWRLCDCLMGEGVVTDDALRELAAGLREHDLDVGWAVETMLRSKLFFADANIATRVKTPSEFVVGAVRALEWFERPPSTLILAEWCTRLGQDLFYPPNVGGWHNGRAWLTTRGIVARANFAAALVEGQLRAPTNPPDLCRLAERYGHSENITQAFRFFERLLLGTELPSADKDRILARAKTVPQDEQRMQTLVSHILSCSTAQLA